MTLDEFLAAMHSKAATVRKAGDGTRAKAEDAAAELVAAHKAHQAAEGRKVELFVRAEQIDKELGRILLEPHETAAGLGAGPAWAAVRRLNAALARCEDLLSRR